MSDRGGGCLAFLVILLLAVFVSPWMLLLLLLF